MDIRLCDLLRKKASPAEVNDNNRFNLAVDKSIQACVDESLQGEDPHKQHLQPLAVTRAQLENHIRSTFEADAKQLQNAIQIFKHCEPYLNKDEHATLMRELDQVYYKLEQLDLSTIETTHLEDIAALSDGCLASVMHIALAKLAEQNPADSLSIFTFLSTIAPHDPEYSFRQGLIAQECKEYGMAIRAYAATLCLRPDFMPCHIFSAECYCQQGQRDLAQAELDRIIQKQAGKEWEQSIEDLKTLIAQGAPNRS